MKIYNTTANFENDFLAIEWCKGIDFSEIETTEGEMPKHSNFIDEVEGVEIYYCYGTDSYFFAEVEKEEEAEEQKEKEYIILGSFENEEEKKLLSLERISGEKITSLKVAMNALIEIRENYKYKQLRIVEVIK